MTTESDTPSGEPGDLDLSAAAEALGEILDPSDPADPEVETELDPPKKDEPGDPPAGVEEGDDAPITLTVDGKQVTLTKAQLADAYKNGLRQDDYTRKTMAAADERKSAEAEKTKAQQERQTYAQNLTDMAAQLKGAIQQQAQIDWDVLLKADPIQYLEQKANLEKRQIALQQNWSEQTRLAEQFQAEQAEASKSHLKDQERELLATLPQWKDDATARKEKDAIKSDLLKRGYTPDQIVNLSDHKTVVMAREAMLYRQMMAKASVAAKRVQAVPERVVRPGVSADRGVPESRTAAARAHAKAGTIESAAELFSTFV